MRKAVLAIMATGSVFAMTAAGASGLTFTSGDTPSVTAKYISTSGGLTITSAAAPTCGTMDSVAYAYNVGRTAVTTVTLTTSQLGCEGLLATLSVGGTGSATFSSGTAAITVTGGTLSTGDNAFTVAITGS